MRIDMHRENIAILAMIVLVAGIALTLRMSPTRHTRLLIEQVLICVDTYHRQTGLMPTDDGGMNQAALQAGFVDAKHTRLIGAAIKRPVIVDDWGTPVRFSLQGSVLQCRSAGPDRIFNTEDDVERSYNWR